MEQEKLTNFEIGFLLGLVIDFIKQDTENPEIIIELKNKLVRMAYK